MTLLRRVLFGLITLSLLFAGLYTGEYIFYIGFGVLLSIVLYAILSNMWVLYAFHYIQELDTSTVRKGDKAVLTLQVYNDRPFLYPFLKIYYHTPLSYLKGESEKGYLSILPFQKGEITHEFDCSLRGKYLLGMNKIEVVDIFGLFKFSMDLTKRPYHKLLRLNIYPRIIKLDHVPLPQITQEGSFKDRLTRTDEAVNVSDIRQYQYSDPMKKVHWKLSSKLQDLYVMNYETTTQPHTMLFMETGPNGLEGIYKHELEDQVIETTTALVNYVLAKWLPLKLIVYENNRKELSGRNPQDFEGIYNYLANLSFDSPFSMKDILDIEAPSFLSNGSIILVIKKLDLSLINSLTVLKQIGVYPIIFFVIHRAYANLQQIQLTDELNEKGIPSYLVYHDQTINEILQA